MNNYSSFAHEFDKTRYNKWKCIHMFCKNINKYDLVLELGCGNGKNIIDIPNSIGVDICFEFCKICNTKNIQTICSNILNINFNVKFDYILCVAVIHHLKTIPERMQLLQIVKSHLNNNGKAIITTWLITYSKRKFNYGDNIVKFNSFDRYYYIFNDNELYNLCKLFFTNIEYYEECDNGIYILS
jgi:SAM-dependent methyltransferase